MPDEKHILYLKHIRDECLYIEGSVKDLKNYNDFAANEDKKRALTRSLEIIGEASKKIPADIKYYWKDIEWKSIAGMRDKLIHDYSGVDYEIVWDTLIHKIPLLLLQINMILSSHSI